MIQRAYLNSPTCWISGIHKMVKVSLCIQFEYGKIRTREHSVFDCKIQKQSFVGVLKNFANFIRKHLCWSIFLIKLQDSQNGQTHSAFANEQFECVWPFLTKACDFIKKRLQHRCFPAKFAKSLRTSLFTEHLPWLQLKLCWS